MRDQALNGRRALVTGASRGIGAAIARTLAQRGAEVFLVARDKEKLANLADELSGFGAPVQVFAADLSDEHSVEQLISAVRDTGDRLDILVNNAGVLPKARRMEKLSRSEWNSILDLNLTSPWFLACRAKEMMAPTGGGVIVNMASTAAFFPSAGLAPYNVSKAGLAMLTKVCALEWARDNVRVLGVAPGKVDTGMVAPILEWSEANNVEINPLRRIGDPTEIAKLVAYLVSDDASYMTGTVVPIDGGELLTFGR
ncbi:hypothetical protein AXA44_36700 [Rhodococcus sp. SC4]|nr:hypothetical protein AXA44_36700 [Rhodococcus sp. SC4]